MQIVLCMKYGCRNQVFLIIISFLLLTTGWWSGLTHILWLVWSVMHATRVPKFNVFLFLHVWRFMVPYVFQTLLRNRIRISQISYACFGKSSFIDFRQEVQKPIFGHAHTMPKIRFLSSKYILTKPTLRSVKFWIQPSVL